MQGAGWGVEQLGFHVEPQWMQCENLAIRLLCWTLLLCSLKSAEANSGIHGHIQQGVNMFFILYLFK